MTTIVAYTKFVMNVMFASIRNAVNTLDVCKVKSARTLVTLRFAYHILHAQITRKNVLIVFLIHIVKDMEKYAFWAIVKNAEMNIVIAEMGNVSILIMNAMMEFVSQIFAGIVQAICFALKDCAFRSIQEDLHVRRTVIAWNQTKFAYEIIVLINVYFLINASAITQEIVRKE